MNKNLCDKCTYRWPECLDINTGMVFASDENPTLTGEEADKVIKCDDFINEEEG